MRRFWTLASHQTQKVLKPDERRAVPGKDPARWPRAPFPHLPGTSSGCRTAALGVGAALLPRYGGGRLGAGGAGGIQRLRAAQLLPSPPP